ncbi:hypothetical protein E2C01_098960 [Portunus trituberculatus]|uniref:Uncharacterized protein n=1 Tax=Portunus trituberculatus TaxID=210409 RepID=A0A5B7KDL6_PORTR|nr:hypothetical protein [Portunus trituberculatus]
MLIIEAHR